jgi:DNA-binding transcriptional LysR family regulator
VRLTEDGQDFLAHARRLVHDAEELVAMFQAPSSLRGRVRVDLPSELAQNHVLPRVPAFLVAYPELELLVSTSDRRVDVLREGFDCVLRVGALADSNLVARRLGFLSMVNVASPGYLLRYGVPKTVDELDRHLVVHYSQTLGGDPPEFEYLTDGDVRVRPMRTLLTVNGTAAYRSACLAGLGIIQAPRLSVRAAVAAGELVEILPDFVCAPMPVSLVQGNPAKVRKPVRAVMSWLAQVVTPLLD